MKNKWTFEAKEEKKAEDPNKILDHIHITFKSEASQKKRQS